MSARLMLLALACACGKSRADMPIETTATPSSRSDAAPAPTSPGAATPTRAIVDWRGSYKSAAGVLYVPADWKNVHWNVKESTAGIGEGTIALTVDSASGRLLGTLEGPLGPATVDGFVADRKMTATIARKEPTDQGFTGTLIGSIAGDHAEGTMNVSPGEASAVRIATFALSPRTAPGAEASPH